MQGSLAPHTSQTPLLHPPVTLRKDALARSPLLHMGIDSDIPNVGNPSESMRDEQKWHTKQKALAELDKEALAELDKEALAELDKYAYNDSSYDNSLSRL